MALLFYTICSFWLVSISNVCFLLTRAGKDRDSEEVRDKHVPKLCCSEVLEGLLADKGIQPVVTYG